MKVVSPQSTDHSDEEKDKIKNGMDGKIIRKGLTRTFNDKPTAGCCLMLLTVDWRLLTFLTDTFPRTHSAPAP